MPTTRPRYFVTETDDLADALNAAAQRQPGKTRSQLLVQLALQGDQAARQAQDERRSLRLAAIQAHSGVATGIYGADYLPQLRKEWPS